MSQKIGTGFGAVLVLLGGVAGWAYLGIGGIVYDATEVIDQVSQTTNQQSRGLGEINTAVGQLDLLTQRNAATAEESASASEELSGQARELQHMVDILGAVINGEGGKGSATPVVAATADMADWAPSATPDWAQAEKPAAGPAKSTRPTHAVIPLEEDELIEI